MGTWRKSPASLIALFDAMLPDDPRIERRKMFGYPCAFVNGNLFAGLHQEDLFVRLDEAGRTSARQALGAGAFEPMPGRPMREYVALPGETLEDEDTLSAWLRKALDNALSLPAKATKRPKTKPAGRARQD